MQATDDSTSERRLHVIDRNTGHKFLIDSGSTISIYPKSYISAKLTPKPLILHAANSSIIKTYGQQLFTLDLKHFQYYLECRQFIIRTDHKPLIYAFQQKAEKASDRQLRQLEYISQFTTDILHLKGDENVVADALSRIEAISMPTILAAAQKDDHELFEIIANSSITLKLQRLELEPDAIIYCDLSTDRIRPYIPQSLRKTAFNIVHNTSHPSRRNTIKTMKTKYVWPSIKRDTNEWAKQCLDCQRD